MFYRNTTLYDMIFPINTTWYHCENRCRWCSQRFWKALMQTPGPCSPRGISICPAATSRGNCGMPWLEEIQVVWRTDLGSPIGEDSLWLCQQFANLKPWPSRNSGFTMGFTHWTWWCSMIFQFVMLIYQRIDDGQVMSSPCQSPLLMAKARFSMVRSLLLGSFWVGLLVP